MQYITNNINNSIFSNLCYAIIKLTGSEKCFNEIYLLGLLDKPYAILVVVLVRYWFSSLVRFRFSSVSVLKPRFQQFHGTGSCTSVLVPTSRYQVQDFQGVICIFFILTPVPVHFGTISGRT